MFPSSSPFSDSDFSIKPNFPQIILFSSNGGTSWTLQSSGTNYDLYAVNFTDAKNGITVGEMGTILKTSNGGVTFVANENKTTLPNDIFLSQNYPNPFNPSTTINYSLAKAGNVRIAVYNLLGSKVATILNENKPAGNYSVNFNATELPSGTYFYKIEAGQFSQVKKMILMK